MMGHNRGSSFILAAVLLVSGAAFLHSAEFEVIDRLSVNGSVLFRSSPTWGGMVVPPLSSTGRGALYFDSSTGKFLVSENGGSYASLTAPVSGGGWTRSAPVVALTNPADNVVVASTLTVAGS